MKMLFGLIAHRHLAWCGDGAAFKCLIIDVLQRGVPKIVLALMGPNFLLGNCAIPFLG